jgi:hypothetical protein
MTLRQQFGGWHFRYRKYRLQEAEGLDPKIVKSIVDGDIRYALKLLNGLAPWQDPEAVARWRPRLEAALEDIKARNLIHGRDFRSRKRRKRIAADKRTCAVCKATMAGKRADARCCSDKCRVRLNRQSVPPKKSGE